MTNKSYFPVTEEMYQVTAKRMRKKHLVDKN